MAIDNQFGKGIGLAAGFDLGAQKPLDSRIAVNTIAERDAHVDNNRAYEGMIVFVDETKKNYQLLNGVWVELFKDEQDRLASLEAELRGEGEGSEGGALATLQANIDAEADRAKGVEQGLQNAIDAINNEENGILAQAKALDKADRDAQLLVDNAQNDRLAALEAKVDVNAEKTVAEQIQAVQDNLDEFEEAQETKEAAQDAKDAALQKAIEDEAAEARKQEGLLQTAINNEKTRAEGAEAGLNAAIEAEVERADAEEKRIVGLLEDEVERADAAEKANAAAIEAEAGRAAGKENELDQAIKAEAATARAAEKANADEIAKQKDAAQEGTLANQIKVEKEARIAADNGLDERLQAVEASVGDGGDLEKRVQANEDAIDVINGNGEGSIKKAVADLVNGAPETLDTLDELAEALRDNKDVLTAIETAFDGKLAELQADVNQNEADCDAAIAAEKQRAEGQEAAIRQEMTAEATRVNEKIADDIAAQAALRVAEEQRIEQECEAAMAQEVLDRNAAIAAEKERAEGQEAAIRTEFADADADLQDAIDEINVLIGNVSGEEGKSVVERVEDIEEIIGSKDDSAGTDSIYGAIADEKAAREEKEADFETRIAANEAFVAAQPAIDEAQNNRIKDLEDANAEGGAVAESVKAAQDAADAAQADVDAVEKIINGDPEVEGDKGLVGRIEANEAFAAAQPAKDQAQDEKIADLEEFVEGHDHIAMENRIAANEAFVGAQPAKDQAQDNRITALEGLFEGENSVDNKIAAAKAAAEAEAARLDGLLKTQLEGYADQAEADAEAEAARLDGLLKTQLEGYADQAEADAKAHAETYTNNALTWGSF